MANTSWIARCKAYMKQHGCQLGEAMKALSNKNKGKGKSFRGGNTGGVADNAEAFSAGAPPTTPPPPTDPSLANLNKEPNASRFEVGAQTQPAKLVMDGGRRKRTNRRRGRKSGSKSKSRSKSRSRSRSGRNRHRSRRGGGHSSLSFSEYN